MNRTRFAFIVGTALLGMSALTACASDEEPAAKDDPSTSESAPDESTAEVKLATAEVGDLGDVVVDGDGRTLYMFDQDTADPPKSNCDGECAAKWPPVIAGSGTPEVDGIDASLVGTVTRSDGEEQVTLGGWPLYLFASDTQAGDAKGQAVGGVWWVLGPDGKKISTQPSAFSGGY
jgi:predicted lipoprotein with Yx(FWY)xxD motif